ncbi:MAG: insulinase family protein, partial [Bilophila wadsworthia]
VSNVLTKGTAKRSATEMQAFLADRAAGLAASAGRKTFSVNLTTPARFNKDLFDLLDEVVTAPAFSKDETARGIKDQLAAIKSREDQPLGLAFRKLPPFLFPGSVYGYLQLGEPENVQKYDEAQLRSFWNRQKARPWVLAV